MGQAGGAAGGGSSADGSGGSAGIRFNLTYDQVESSKYQRPSADGNASLDGERAAVAAADRSVPEAKAGPNAGFDYPRYRQSHSMHKGNYIDVRLVPREVIQAAAEAAANGRTHQLRHIPGMRDEAVAIGVMARMVRDSDSAWAAAGSPRAEGSDGRAASEGASDGDNSDCMSEEVVSNTVGLSNIQASGFSGMMGRAAAVRGAALKADIGQGECDDEVDMAEAADEVMSERAGGHKRTWQE